MCYRYYSRGWLSWGFYCQLSLRIFYFALFIIFCYFLLLSSLQFSSFLAGNLKSHKYFSRHEILKSQGLLEQKVSQKLCNTWHFEYPEIPQLATKITSKVAHPPLKIKILYLRVTISILKSKNERWKNKYCFNFEIEKKMWKYV